MDELTMTVKSEIKRKYKSVRQFAAAIDIPQSTIISGLRKGVGGMAFDTVVKMCTALGIKLSMNSGVFMDKEKSELLEYFGELDDRGRYTVRAVCNVELLRCRNVPVTSVVAALDKIQNPGGDKND
ncbi:MAG: helix-turn-helix transcriptional regulator [Ruminococcaceae bacterium]|nr:helix-turn-helix transcriptional regulator [Oscillospiraceae bacterium]